MRVTFDGDNYHMTVSPGEMADLRTAVLFSISNTRDNSVLYHEIVAAARDAARDYREAVYHRLNDNTSNSELNDHLNGMAF